MLVMQRQRRGIQRLHHPDAPLDPEALPLRPCRDPGERYIRYTVVILVESADIAMSARKDQFLNDTLLLGSKRNILEEAPRLVARYGVPRLLDVSRTCLRHVQPNRGVDRVPQPEVGDVDAELVEPRRSVPREQSAAGEAEDEDVCRYAVRWQRLVHRLQPASGRSKRRPPVGANDLPDDIRAEVRPEPRLKVKNLPFVSNTGIIKPRHIGESAGDALTSAFKK